MVNMKIVRHVPEAIYHTLNLLSADIPGLSEYTQTVEVNLARFGKDSKSFYGVSTWFDDAEHNYLVVVDVNAYDTSFESFTLAHTKDMYTTVLGVLYHYAVVGREDLNAIHELFVEGEKAIKSTKSFAGAWDDLVHYTRLLKYEMDKGD